MLTASTVLNIVHIHGLYLSGSSRESLEGGSGMGKGNADLSRRSLLACAIAVAAAAATGTTTAAATPSRGQVPVLWHEFVRAPFTHPQIPYVGRAGHRRGTERFPRRPWWPT